MAVFTEADVIALRASIKSGTKSVSYQDRSVSYHSFEEMLKLLAWMEAEVAGGTGGRSTLASFHRDGNTTNSAGYIDPNA